MLLELQDNDNISIHAPRGGSDLFTILASSSPLNFNPRSPWGERLSPMALFIPSVIFQSTLPVGGATFLQGVKCRCAGNFNPRSPWGERPDPACQGAMDHIFQSTLPVGGATC